MTGPTASISLSTSLPTALPGTAALPSLLAVGAPAGTPGAVPTLAAFVDLMAAQPQAPATPTLPADERQDDAAPGNALPDDKEDVTADPALAWLMAVPALPSPVPAAPTLLGGGTTLAAPTPAPVDAAALPLAAKAAQTAQPFDPRVGITPDPVPEPVAVELDAPAIAPPVAASDPTPSQPVTTPVDTPVRIAADRPAPVAQPLVQIVVAAAAQRTPQAQPVTLARILTANAPQPALFALAVERDRGDDGEAKPLSAATTAATLLQPADAAALIAKPGEAQRQALDMGQPDWPQKMIDRIETLRDNANANDTSIRLKPDALGRVDISLRTQADGVVAVRFAAEQPATRALIADAAPQLTAAAEARGIRLSQTSVDLAGSGQGQRQSQGFERPQHLSNRLASSEAQEAVSDGRVA